VKVERRLRPPSPRRAERSRAVRRRLPAAAGRQRGCRRARCERPVERLAEFARERL